MRKLLVIFAGLLLAFSVQAQKVAGIVNDENGKGLEKTTVALLRARDSVSLKLAVTDANGKYSFQVPAGKYLVSVSHVGYANQRSKVFEVSADAEVPAFTMNKVASNLAGVTVTSEKPMIEVKADKTILNVEGTINATGNDALELLRKSPGIMIDKDENISLAGKNGVQVYIDGKPSPLSGTDLANFLHSLQSTQIEVIEIITNPSAKYEAAGNAGIINIKLKKNKAFGTNGSVNAGYVQGVYPKYNAGLNINHRNAHINVFGNFNYNYGKNLMAFTSKKIQFDTSFDQSNKIRFINNTPSFKTGLDYFINKNSTIGTVLTGNFANNQITTSGPMYFTYLPTGQLNRILRATNDNKVNRNNFNTNLNYRYAVTGGTELNIDADYGLFRIKSNQYQPNYYYQPDGVTEISRVIYNMLSPTNIDLFSLKTDYEQNYKGGRLGIGGKIGIVNTDNDFQRYDVYSSGKILDTSKSNRFKYKENINALYVNYNKQFKKGVMIQFGLRVENTHSRGNSTGFKKVGSTYTNYDSTFKRDYTDPFPSASITFNKNPKNQWTFSYSRRIDRPAYQDLNPFEFKLNEYTFMKGNTTLRPQYTNSFGMTNVYKYKLTTTLNYSHVKDIFAQIPDTIDKTKGFLTKKNLATQDIVALNISYPFQYKWYGFFATINANYSHYVADFGGGTRKVDQSVAAATVFMQNTIKFGKGWTGEVSGLFITPGVWGGVIRTGTMGSMDVGIQKVILKGLGNVKLACSDVLKTMKWSGKTDFAGVHSTFEGHGEQQQIKLNFSYRFGKNTVKASRQRQSGIEDEKKRADQGGGGMMGQ